MTGSSILLFAWLLHVQVVCQIIFGMEVWMLIVWADLFQMHKMKRFFNFNDNDKTQNKQWHAKSLASMNVALVHI